MGELFVWTYDGPNAQGGDEFERLQEARLLAFLIDDELGLVTLVRQSEDDSGCFDVVTAVDGQDGQDVRCRKSQLRVADSELLDERLFRETGPSAVTIDVDQWSEVEQDPDVPMDAPQVSACAQMEPTHQHRALSRECDRAQDGEPEKRAAAVAVARDADVEFVPLNARQQDTSSELNDGPATDGTVGKSGAEDDEERAREAAEGVFEAALAALTSETQLHQLDRDSLDTIFYRSLVRARAVRSRIQHT